MTPANAATAMATVLVDELLRHGVVHAVLAPGSRSAALAFALEAADRDGRLTLHTRVDERSAAYLALGLAVTSRSPVPVVCTSGTAVANLHPAMLEAAHRGIPLLGLTADRPARLRGTQANQTTDQVGIFGTATRYDADVPPGDPHSDQAVQIASWQRLVGDALAAAEGIPISVSERGPIGHVSHTDIGGTPGPVHLNLQFDDPLVPGIADGWTEAVDRRFRDNSPGGSPPQPPVGPAEPRDGQVRPRDEARVDPTVLELGPRTVVVAGDDAGPPARMLAEQGGWPLLAEPTSGSRTGDNAIRTYRLLLGDTGGTALADRIERVIVCGHPTLSRPVTRLISSPDVEVTAVRNRTGYTDPGRAVSRVLDWPVRVSTGSTTEENGSTTEETADDGWLAEWKQRDAERGRALDALLAAQGRLTPHQVAGAVAAALPPEGLLFVGASNPVRDLDLMVPRYRVGDRRLVIGNRGLAGIDGSVSTAVGAVLGRPRTTRAFALLGDVTFLHDSNGLVIGPDEPRPDLTIVVVNDDGGSVFASLEQGDPAYSSSYERLFGTPHRVDLASLCAATRTAHWKVDSLPELRQALANPNGGIEVVEAVVRRDDRRDLDTAIRDLGQDA